MPQPRYAAGVRIFQLIARRFRSKMSGMCPVRTHPPPPLPPCGGLSVGLGMDVTHTQSMGCNFYPLTDR